MESWSWVWMGLPQKQLLSRVQIAIVVMPVMLSRPWHGVCFVAGWPALFLAAVRARYVQAAGLLFPPTQPFGATVVAGSQVKIGAK